MARRRAVAAVPRVEAAVEATQEAVVNALLAAETTTGKDGGPARDVSRSHARADGRRRPFAR
jgi:L-aminopeptidase/D-esterase-like protein